MANLLINFANAAANKYYLRCNNEKYFLTAKLPIESFLKKIIVPIIMKDKLIDKLGVFLLKDGFTVKSLTRTCFDLLARKQEKILLIKVLEDANAVSKEYTDAMNTVSSYIGAVPIMIAEKAGDKLEDNILY